VGNLPWVADDAALLGAFATYNPVSATVVYGRDGRSRGYGIVEFGTVDEAGMAIDGMNQTKFNGGERPMNVRYDVGKAIPDSQKAGFQRNYDDTLYVGNLPWGVTWQQLKDLFQDHNPEYADVKMGPDGRSRGWGTVRFATGDDANAAIAQFDGYELIGRNGPRSIEVRKDRGPTRKD
jgi:RNA recognition motif-containing protein